MTDIMTPALGESVSEATVARWAKKAGDAVMRDEILVELETDKVSLEVASPEDGVLGEISAEEGATVVPGQRLGRVDQNAGAVAKSPPKGAESPATAAEPQAAPAPAAAAMFITWASGTRRRTRLRISPRPSPCGWRPVRGGARATRTGQRCTSCAPWMNWWRACATRAHRFATAPASSRSSTTRARSSSTTAGAWRAIGSTAAG